MATVPLDEAAPDVSDLVAKVEAGEDVVFTRDEKPVARLVALPTADARRPTSVLFGVLKGKITLDESFFDPLPEEELRLWEGR
jgi:antitoxin (DNA-binding transcriptional repressor) of toxin-antitoxin stability system